MYQFPSNNEHVLQWDTTYAFKRIIISAVKFPLYTNKIFQLEVTAEVVSMFSNNYVHISWKNYAITLDC